MQTPSGPEIQKKTERKNLRQREFRATAFLLVLGMALWFLEWGINHFLFLENPNLDPGLNIIASHKALVPIVWVICFLSYAVYITKISSEIRRAERDLAESEERYRLLAQNSLTGIYIHIEGLLVYVNERFCEITGYLHDELVGTSFWQHVYQDDRNMVRERDIARVNGQPVVSQYEFRFICRDGTITWVEVLATVLDYRGTPANMGNVSDISERKRADKEREELITDLMHTREALHFKATHDALTGLLNRAALFDSLEREIARCNREDKALAIIMADLDHFKKINDNHGHLAGDAVLKEVADRISDSVRPYDVVGRYGGEEILIGLPACDESGAFSFAERIRSAIGSREISTNDGKIAVTVSLGIAVFRRSAFANMDEVIRVADAALYDAKKAGRNCVRSAQAISEQAIG
ncbi:sensor domain-containing diguanylate cyclase [Desulfomonile tiedjei]|nr:diguanylate cyclase [Desulfomonile tiedjei]